MRKTHTIILLVLSLILLGCSREAQVGKVFPAWQEGELDIHFINTARGECTYQILPDGTTFLVDASGGLMAFGIDISDPLPAKPSDKISAGKVIVDYINHFNPRQSKGRLDYFLLTHFDSDHFGTIKDTLAMHESGLFRLGSLPYIGSELKIGAIFDRAYPDYDYPNAKKFKSTHIRNYRAFTEWTAAENGTKIARWQAGSTSQIMLKHNDKYDFSLRAYSSSGEFWTGEGEQTIKLFPTKEEFAEGSKEAVPAENAFCNSYILSYGNFDFFHGGDLQYNKSDIFPYMDAEAPVAKVAHKVELMKANHHGTAFTNSELLLSTLKPDAVVFNPWRDVHPRPCSIERILNANPDCEMFSTNMPAKNEAVLGDYLQLFKAKSGHIVVRVAEGGESYMIYSLDDNDQEYRVTGIYGPYECSERY